MSRVRVPDGAFELPLQVRSYEVGCEGRVRPANVLRYFEYLATEDSTQRGFDHAWYEEHGSAWVVREMRLMLGELPGIGEWLRMATWVSSYGRVQAYREYALWREGGIRLIARAQGRWAYVDRAGGQLRRVPDELVARLRPQVHAMATWSLPAVDTIIDREAYPDRTESVVAFGSRGYEADSQQHINNAVYMDWLEEVTALELGSAQGGVAPTARLRRIHLEYLRPALPGTGIHVSVRTAAAARRRLVAEFAVSAGGELAPVLRARALYLLARPPA
jgi:medium-chain acyl-[acyl-carrier-protein] hydrolase